MVESPSEVGTELVEVVLCGGSGGETGVERASISTSGLISGLISGFDFSATFSASFSTTFVVLSCGGGGGAGRGWTGWVRWAGCDWTGCG